MDHICKKEDKIEIIYTDLQDLKKDVKFLVNNHYEQKGKIAIISLLFTGVGYLVAWFFNHK